MSQAIGIIGVGNIGSAMMTHLLAVGHKIYVYDVSSKQAEIARAAGANVVDRVATVAAHAKIIISSLPTSEALDQTIEGLCTAHLDGVILVETSTLPISQKQIARAKVESVGGRMLDAPVSGTGAQAQAADIAIFVSGEKKDFDQVAPILQPVARSVRYLGDFGAGMAMKLIANHLVAIHSLAAAEAMALGVKAGLNPDLMVEILVDSAGASSMFAVRAPMMAKDTFEPVTAHLDILLKDIGFIEQVATENHASVPLFAKAAEIYREARDQGFGRRDIAEIYRFIRDQEN